MYYTGPNVSLFRQVKQTMSSSATVGEGKASVVGKASIKQKVGKSKLVEPGSFEPERHFYPRVLNAQVHPMVSSFFALGNERIIARYCHMHPAVSPQNLRDILNYRPQHFRYGKGLVDCLRK